MLYGCRCIRLTQLVFWDSVVFQIWQAGYGADTRSATKTKDNYQGPLDPLIQLQLADQEPRDDGAAPVQANRHGRERVAENRKPVVQRTWPEVKIPLGSDRAAGDDESEDHSSSENGRRYQSPSNRPTIFGLVGKTQQCDRDGSLDQVCRCCVKHLPVPHHEGCLCRHELIELGIPRPQAVLCCDDGERTLGHEGQLREER